MLFTVLRDDANLGTGAIDATHKWFLPGVICLACKSTWGNVGLEYPSVDLSSLDNERAYQAPRPVAWSKFESLREPVARLMGPDALLLPGTHFGQLVGKAKGRFTADFAWVNLWTLLATAESFSYLKDRFPNLKGVTPELTFTGPDRPTLLELELEPQGEVVLPPQSNGAGVCETCGRDPSSLPDRIVIAKSSIPQDLHLFRARNFTTVLLATERFVKAVQDLGFVGLNFEEVTVSDSIQA